MKMSKHSPLVYHRAALTHVGQAVAVAFTAMIALFTLSVAFASVAFVLTEAVLIVLVPKTRSFRAHVDQQIEIEAHAASIGARARLIARMSDVHAAELNELERLAADIRARGLLAMEPIESTERGVERVLDVERLLLSYVRLSVAHRRSVETFSTERGRALEGQLAHLTHLAEATTGAKHVREWVARRRAMLTIRRETWLRATDDRETIQHALATIGDTIRWMHELCAVPAEDPGRAALDDVLAGCTAALATVRRLESDLAVDETFFEAVAAPKAPVQVTPPSRCLSAAAE